MSDDLDWRQRALCSSDPDGWFPEEIRPAAARLFAVEAAKAGCRSCPVRRECGTQALRLESGVPADMRFGVRGAMTPAERAAADPVVQARKRVAA
nr:hypothetical protein KitaXyl93_20410 [Kitasatospora sp. Xyl93]